MYWNSTSIRPEDLFLSSIPAFLDKKILVLAMDGRKLLGTLRSFDRHGNIVLEGAYDRVIVDNLYCDNYLGLLVIRGYSLALLGDLAIRELPPFMTRVSEVEIKEAQKAKGVAGDLKKKTRDRMNFLDFD
ncbi:sm-like protein LSM1B isoform X2 [Amaranthus tricolor]|uniref:sm-like protein LSM1B isoform X2 n=1 Tax=Amaranthus tricolor TaxID=29722 RepID=UPI0025894E97|nr:sm-like protein LSM1B isoform X2 [Amaranthus tricolor]